MAAFAIFSQPSELRFVVCPNVKRYESHFPAVLFLSAVRVRKTGYPKNPLLIAEQRIQSALGLRQLFLGVKSSYLF